MADTEPGTAHPRQRLRALSRIVAAGIRAGVGMAPILPGLSDDPSALRDVAIAAREAGATHLWWNVLNLRPGTREHFLEHLARDWPEEVERYQRLYAGRAYLTASQTAELNATLAEMRSEWVWAPNRPVQPAGDPHRPPIEQLELRLVG